VETYLQEIGRVPLLTAAQERSLARALRAGDPHARAGLVAANLRLVVKIASQFMHRGLAMHDLVGEGNLGLMRAADKFDPDAGCRFSTYATWWIMQSIRLALRNQVRVVRIPNHMLDRLALRLRTRTRLAGVLGREPTESELMLAMGLAGSTARRLLDSVETAERRVASLSTAPSHEDTASLAELIADTSRGAAGEELDVRDQLRRLLMLVGLLDERRREVLMRRFGMTGDRPQTLDEIGRHLGLTRERVRQLEQQALDWLRLGLRRGEQALRLKVGRLRRTG
jgi:RNA polymerase sigma factor (sigma-70 family)